jgi:hypothetical protein
MDTISGMTHFKVIFSFSACIGEHFVDNIVCSSNSSFMQLIHILHPFSINKDIYKPPKEKL